MEQLRADMPEPPPFMRDLPVDDRGYPVPWFVDWINGKPEFRAMDRQKFVQAIRDRRCWVCGKPLWREMVFVIGPMCSVNRVSSEPPSHRECAQFSARACPFLSKPQMIRREGGGMPEETRKNAAGIMVARNPGVTLLWYTYRYELMKVDAIPEAGAKAGYLFKLGRPFKTEWYARGRPATRDEVLESINTGMPLLYEANRKQGGDVAALDVQVARQLDDAMRFLPR